MQTLGVFAKQPVPGRVKTRLAADWDVDRAATLYECFVRDLLNRFRDAGDRRVVGFAPDLEAARDWFGSAAPGSQWTLWAQPEVGLGGRMEAFFTAWGDDDADRTLLIGSDSPSIPDSWLDHAWRLLEDSDCVIGPASDGGYWLIGLRGSVTSEARRAVFDGVDWSTANVLAQSVERVARVGLRLELLPVWYDVDSAEDVEMLRGHLQAMAVAGEKLELPETSRFLGLAASQSNTMSGAT